MATLAAAYNVLCPGVGGAQPGDLCSGTNTTLCLMAGTYPMSARFQTKKERMGTPTRIITFMPEGLVPGSVRLWRWGWRRLRTSRGGVPAPAAPGLPLAEPPLAKRAVEDRP